MPFIIYEISSFVKTLTNMIDYMKEYEKTKIICRKYPYSSSYTGCVKILFQVGSAVISNSMSNEFYSK
jgi:hypothetical protein